MKKLLFIFCISLVLSGACGKKPEEKVQEFAVKFGDFINTNQKDSIQDYYPDFQLSDSLATVSITGINVYKVPEVEENNYIIEYDPDITLFVDIEKDGTISVEDSKGLFYFPEKQIEMLRKQDLYKKSLTDLQLADLIKEENAKRLSFTSPDLDFFTLHGPVKSVTVSNRSKGDFSASYYLLGYSPDWEKPATYTFDENGEWTNYPRYRIRSIKRNGKGQIISLHEPVDLDEVDPTVRRYTWDGHQLAKVSYDWSRYEGWEGASFKYSNGVVTEEKGIYSNTADEVNYKITFSDFQTDDYGNWISCSWTRSDTYPDYDDYDSGKMRTDRSSGTIIREISYY